MVLWYVGKLITNGLSLYVNFCTIPALGLEHLQDRDRDTAVFRRRLQRIPREGIFASTVLPSLNVVFALACALEI